MGDVLRWLARLEAEGTVDEIADVLATCGADGADVALDVLLGLPDAIGGGEALEVLAVGARAEVELEPLAVRGHLLDLFLAQHGTKVVERGAVGDPGAEQPRDVVGHHRLGAVAAPALADLAEVLKDREDLHTLAGRGRGDLAEVGQRRDVGGLVEAQQQRRVDRLPGPRRAREGLLDDGVDERREQAAEPVLVVGRRGQIEGVGPLQ